MKVAYASLRDAVVLPIPGISGTNGRSYSTLIANSKELPGVTMEIDDVELTLFKDGVKVAGFSRSNIRGHTYVVEEQPTLEAEVVPAETPAAEVVAQSPSLEVPRRKFRG